MKRVVCIFLILITFNSFSQNYGNLTYTEAVNILGMQRMLSQKMSKVYMMRLNGSYEEDTDEEFKDNIRLFNKNLIKLEENSVNSFEKTKQLIDDEKLEWEKFLKEFLLNPSNDVNKLLVLANGLLDKCKVLAVEIENEAILNNKNTKKDKVKTKIVMLSDMQTMLSQRLSLYYLASKLNVNNTHLSDTQTELQNVFIEMEKSFKKLSKNKLNTKEINLKFKIIEEEFELITKNRQDFENQKIETEKILAFSNKITSIYNSITDLYTEL